MNWYTTLRNSINEFKVSPEVSKSISFGNEKVFEHICRDIEGYYRTTNKPCCVGMDGYIGAQWENIVPKIVERLQKQIEHYQILYPLSNRLY